MFFLRRQFKSDLYVTNMMLDHVQLVQRTLGQAITIDYMIYLEHIAFQLAFQLQAISETTKQIFPDIDWQCIDRLQDLVEYEVQHFKLGDVIETVDADLTKIGNELIWLQVKLRLRLEGDRKQDVKENR